MRAPWRVVIRPGPAMRPFWVLLKRVTCRLPRDWPDGGFVAHQTPVHRSVHSSRLGVSRNAAASASELAVNNGGFGSPSRRRSPPPVFTYPIPPPTQPPPFPPPHLHTPPTKTPPPPSPHPRL